MKTKNERAKCLMLWILQVLLVLGLMVNLTISFRTPRAVESVPAKAPLPCSAIPTKLILEDLEEVAHPATVLWLG